MYSNEWNLGQAHFLPRQQSKMIEKEQREMFALYRYTLSSTSSFPFRSINRYLVSIFSVSSKRRQEKGGRKIDKEGENQTGKGRR